jgi:hypothetical protein
MTDISIIGIPSGSGTKTDVIEVGGDVDRFNITLRGGELYEFRANSFGALDPTLTLNRPAGPAKFNDDISPSNRNSLIQHQAGSTANYSLDVAGFGSSTGTYQVVASEVPGNTSTYSTLTVGGSTTGDLHALGDHDFHKVTLTAGHTYRFNLDGADFGSGKLADPMLELRNSAGTVVAKNDNAGGTNNSRIDFTATTSGTYFANARTLQQTTGLEFPGTLGTGGYKLAATQIA